MNRILTKVRSNLFFRTMFASLFGRNDSSKEPGRFKPYFQYRIGLLKVTDEYLYFDKEPFPVLYYNEIFNKIYAYSEGHISHLLDFHFEAYEDKQDFLKFFEYQSEERLNMKSGNSARLQSVVKWVKAQKEMNTDKMNEVIRQEIEIPENFQGINSDTTIIFSDNSYGDKVAQVFQALRELHIPVAGKKASVPLFKKFSDIDLASIFRLHFEPYKNKKLSTLQKLILNMRNDIDKNSAKWIKLNEALLEFFKD